MLTPTQEAILKFLFEHQEEKNTIRQLSRKLNKSYTLVYNNLQALEKTSLIQKHSIPPSKIISLNENAPQDFFIDLELKRKNDFLKKHSCIMLMLNDFLANSSDHFFIFLIFGSYAKNLADEKSDLDLLIICEEKQISSFKTAISQVYTKVKKSANIISINDFKEMLSTRNFNIVNEAKANHILLHGVEQYYSIIKSL